MGRGVVKKSKKSQVSVGNSSILGGGSSEIKKVPSSRGYQGLQNYDSFSSYEDQKHKILSIVVLNIISLIFTELILGGVGTHFKKSQVPEGIKD